MVERVRKRGSIPFTTTFFISHFSFFLLLLIATFPYGRLIKIEGVFYEKHKQIKSYPKDSRDYRFGCGNRIFNGGL
jgi:hypothetical protein